MSHPHNRQQAEAIARAHLSELVADITALTIEAIELESIGWMFTYQTRAFLETGDFNDGLLGNAPIIVDYRGQLHEPSSGEALNTYIETLRGSLLPPDATT